MMQSFAMMGLVTVHLGRRAATRLPSGTATRSSADLNTCFCAAWG